jgi:BirA family biotin operon repressor/biotin-[acetyl-CoA-carboxylase] ligase
MSASDGTLPSLPSFFSLAAHDCLGSTSDEAKRLAEDGAAPGTLVWALEQTGGRGRLDRRWISPRGNLFASIVLRPAAAPARAAELGFVAALAVADTVRPFLPDTVTVALKWPNDVLAQGGKIAGILLEARSGLSGAVDWVVVGIGINVSAAPVGALYETSCLGALAGAAPSVGAVLERLAGAFVSRLESWEQDGFAPTRQAWLAQAQGLGGKLEIRQGGETLTGRFLDLDSDGALLLETPTGMRRVTAGDVHFPPV